MSQSEVNYEVVNIQLDLTVYQAAEIRRILFEAQQGYGLSHVPERISGVREVIESLDRKIQYAVDGGCPPGTVMVDGECANL
jgi:hypothetical protein